MSNELLDLVNEILATGKAKGLTQKAIAQLAQLDEVSLSRAKTAEDMKFSTLNALAKSVGLRCVLVPDSNLAEKVRKGELFDD